MTGIQQKKLEQELEALKIYCNAARRAKQISLCKLLLRDEIATRITKYWKILHTDFGE